MKVSVIIPCRNEEETIGLLLDALYHQTFKKQDFEAVVADGLSDDRTREVIQNFAEKHPGMKIRVIDNPKRTIPAGLNLALKTALGEIIIRLDAHSIPAENYLEMSVKLLEEGKADNVGGRWQIRPAVQTWIAKSIAAAAMNPLGVGDASYRYSNRPAYTDTVPFGHSTKKEFLNWGVQ